MSNAAPHLWRSATFALELARRSDGYLAPYDDVIEELRNAGLVTTHHVMGGFAIVKAVMRPSRRRRPNGQWGWTMEGVPL